MKYSHSLVTIIGLIGIGVPAIVVGALRTSTEAPPAGRDRPASRAAATRMRDPPRVPDPGPEPARPRAALDARAEQERKVRAYLAGVGAAFRAETADPQWSSATSSVIRTALAADGELRLLARSVECRSRTCRVEIADDGPGKLGMRLPMFAQRVSDELPGMLVDRIESATGVAVLVLYLSRNHETQANSRR